LSGVSCSFEIVNATVRDADGDVRDVEEGIERRPDDPNLSIIVERAVLREVSITAMPADRNACVCTIGIDAEGVWCDSSWRIGIDRILHSMAPALPETWVAGSRGASSCRRV